MVKLDEIVSAQNYHIPKTGSNKPVALAPQMINQYIFPQARSLEQIIQSTHNRLNINRYSPQIPIKIKISLNNFFKQLNTLNFLKASAFLDVKSTRMPQTNQMIQLLNKSVVEKVCGCLRPIRLISCSKKELSRLSLK